MVATTEPLRKLCWAPPNSTDFPFDSTNDIEHFLVKLSESKGLGTLKKRFSGARRKERKSGNDRKIQDDFLSNRTGKEEEEAEKLETKVELRK